MTVSIALATFNGSKFLKEQLNSLDRQSKRPDEVIISDDGSTDATLEILQQWTQNTRIKRVEILTDTKPKGFTSNFIRAFQATKGELVFPCDQDDVWFPHKIERMVDFMSKNQNLQTAVHDAEITDSDLEPIGERMIARARGLGGAMRDHNSGMSTVVKRDFLETCLQPPREFPFDNWIHHCALALGVKGILEEPLVFYRRHQSAVTDALFQNSSKKQNLLELKIRYAKHVISKDRNGADLLREQEKLSSTTEWIKKNETKLKRSGISDERIGQSLQRLECRKEMTRKRFEIRNRPRLFRLRRALQMAANGEYAEYNGAGAFFKDILL